MTDLTSASSRQSTHPSFNVGVALATLTTIAIVGTLGVRALGRNSIRVPGAASRSKSQADVEVSLTIERGAEELYALWREPGTLSKIIGHFARVAVLDDARLRWSARGLADWHMRLTEERPNEVLRWQAEETSALLRQLAVHFLPAPQREGTVVKLHLNLHPNNLVQRAATRFMHNVLPRELAAKTLRYFKSLVLTGEIPTTEGQPAARRDTR